MENIHIPWSRDLHRVWAVSILNLFVDEKVFRSLRSITDLRSPVFWKPEKLYDGSLAYWYRGHFPQYPCPPSFEFLCWPEDAYCSDWTWIVMSREVCDGISGGVLPLWWTPPKDLYQVLATSSRTFQFSPNWINLVLGRKEKFWNASVWNLVVIPSFSAIRFSVRVSLKVLLLDWLQSLGFGVGLLSDLVSPWELNGHWQVCCLVCGIPAWEELVAPHLQ